MRQIHKILGLAISLYVIVIGLSGSVLVFREEIASMVRPDLHTGPAPVFGADPDLVLAELRRSYPGWQPLSITWPYEHSPYWMIYLLHGPEALQVYVDPANGGVVGTHDPHSGFLGLAERIHSNFTFGRNGRLANGYGAIGVIVLSLSGLWLVWPRLRRLQWRGDRGWHYGLGAVSFLFLMGISITGAYFTWSKPYIDFAKTYLGRTVEPVLAPGGTSTLPIWRLMELAQEAMPGKNIQRVPIPNAKYPLRVTFREGTFAELHRISAVTLDPRDGRVLLVQRARPAGDVFLGWLVAFHFGAFGGLAVKLLWAAFGVVMVVLSVTGARIWWLKSKA